MSTGRVVVVVDEKEERSVGDQPSEFVVGIPPKLVGPLGFLNQLIRQDQNILRGHHLK